MYLVSKCIKSNNWPRNEQRNIVHIDKKVRKGILFQGKVCFLGGGVLSFTYIWEKLKLQFKTSEIFGISARPVVIHGETDIPKESHPVICLPREDPMGKCLMFVNKHSVN